MELKRVASIYLSVCLVVVYILSAPIEAQAAADDVADRPVWDDSYAVDEQSSVDPPPDPEDIEQLSGAAANSLADLDSLDLEPLPKAQVDYILAHADDPVEEIAEHMPEEIDNYDDQVEPLLAVTVTASVAMILLIMFHLYGSGYKLNGNAASIDYDMRKAAGNSSFSESFKYMKNRAVTYVTITAAMVKSLVDKLDACQTDDGYSISLTENDRAVLGYFFSDNSVLSYVDTSSVNVKPIGGYKYYYYMSSGYRPSADTIELLYTPDKVAYAKRTKAYSTYRYDLLFYHYNPLLAADDKYEPMKYAVAYYNISQASGLYEFSDYTEYSGTGNGSDTMGDFDRRLSSLPFNIFSNSYSEWKSYYEAASSLMMTYNLAEKSVDANSLFKLKSVSTTEEITAFTNTSKNIYARVTGVNRGVGAIAVDGKVNAKVETGTDSGTAKPGTDAGTDTGSGTVSASVAADIASIKSLVGSLQTTIAAQSSVIASITSELQAIKSAVLSLQQGLSVTVDNTATLKAIEELKKEVVNVKSLIDTIPATIAAQNELIEVIPGEIADTRDALEVIRAEIAALSDTITDTFPATADITAAITDTKIGVKDSVDALPGSIANSMVVAGTKELTNTKDESSFAFTNPLSSRFPFSIPWDIAGCITLLKSDPVEPVWKIPFKVENNVVKINEEFVIDLSGEQWQTLVKIIRAFILIIFVASLAAVTRILIKG